MPLILSCTVSELKKKLGIAVIVGSLSSEKKRKIDDVCYFIYFCCFVVN